MDRLEEIMADYPKFRLKQVKKHLYQELIIDWRDSTVLPQDMKDRLTLEFPINIEADTVASKERDTSKALIKLSDGLYVETVLMRHGDGRNTVCVSSQVGCALNCAFCATGMMGFKRDLGTWEMVQQVIFFARILKEEGERITNVVFMGMGEPFLNYENVMSAVRVLNDKEGFNLGARNFSISTAGVIEGIDKLSEEDLQINLAISLHSPDNETRSKLMPINRKYPLESVLEAVSRYTEKTNRQVMFEYMLIKDLNDSDRHAEELAKIMKGHLYVVNLISYNPTGPFKPSPTKRVQKFKEILERKGVKVTRRHSFGADIKSACGQLASLD
ncbi:MAG: 23S rRNA (adenine(2503)-C(2))-methyltransferase RlmN [Patescibacteria group bacterium]